MFEKIWNQHVVHSEPQKQTILYIDLHLVHEVTSAQAFEGLRLLAEKFVGLLARLRPPTTTYQPTIGIYQSPIRSHANRSILSETTVKSLEYGSTI